MNKSSHLSPNPPFSLMGSGPAGRPVQSVHAIYLYSPYLPLLVPISSCHPSFLWPSSLSPSLYSHFHHHLDVFLSISPSNMTKPLESSYPHAHRNCFELGHFLYAVIRYMIFPPDIVNMSHHSHFSSTDSVFLLLCYWPEFISI